MNRLNRKVPRNVPVLRFALLAGLLAAIALPSEVPAAELFLTGEREIYLAIDKLNAMGHLPGTLANTRPYSAAAVRAALDNNKGVSSGTEFDSQLARWVAFSVKDPLIVRGTVAVEGSEKRRTRENDGDVPTPKGVSARLSALARETSSPYVSAHASGSAFFGESGDDGTRLGDTALEAGIPQASLQAGMISAWYGPGRRGALQFTNNARSYPGIRFHSPVPIPIKGFFSFLGSVQYDMFFARLTDERPVTESILTGIRLAARPNRYLEIGFSRAIHYGGDGHDDGPSAWWDAFKGTDDNREDFSGNQLGGFDLTVTLPFRTQPVQVYLEMAGEDEAKMLGTSIPGPTNWTILGGLFLPAILGNPALDLRAEYADNHRHGEGGAWYTHTFYPHEYEGRILGHPMGTDARDAWVQGHYYFTPAMYLELTVNRTDRFALGPLRETTNRASAGFVGWLSGKTRVEVESTLEKVKNPGGIDGSDDLDAAFRVAISHQIGW